MVALNRMNLREQAIAELRAQILSGELEAGQVYSATMLAGDLGVSPTPVREAMLELANGGLVEAVPNKGFRVIAPTDDDLNEITELRLMLEVPALSEVIERATDRDLARLDAPVRKCAEAAGTGDVTRFLLADRDFHLGLLKHAGNQRLCRLVAALRDQTRLFGLKNLAESGQLDESAAEHGRILAAVKARDAARAQDFMERHLRHTRGIWAGQVEDSGQSDAAPMPA